MLLMPFASSLTWVGEGNLAGAGAVATGLASGLPLGSAPSGFGVCGLALAVSGGADSGAIAAGLGRGGAAGGVAAAVGPGAGVALSPSVAAAGCQTRTPISSSMARWRASSARLMARPSARARRQVGGS